MPARTLTPRERAIIHTALVELGGMALHQVHPLPLKTVTHFDETNGLHMEPLEGEPVTAKEIYGVLEFMHSATAVA